MGKRNDKTNTVQPAAQAEPTAAIVPQPDPVIQNAQQIAETQDQGQGQNSDEHGTGLVRVRVLVDCAVGKCNDVATVQAEDLPGLAGLVDPHPDAVAYAESLVE